jgi:hypothetical protein
MTTGSLKLTITKKIEQKLKFILNLHNKDDSMFNIYISLMVFFSYAYSYILVSILFHFFYKSYIIFIVYHGDMMV